MDLTDARLVAIWLQSGCKWLQMEFPSAGNLAMAEVLRGFSPSNGTNLIFRIILAGDIETKPGHRYAKSTVRHRIDSLKVGNAKNTYTLQVTTNS